MGVTNNIKSPVLKRPSARALSLSNIWLLPPMRVSLTGLTKGPWLNGAEANCVRYDRETGCMIVRMKASKELTPVKPENLEKISPDKKFPSFSERQLKIVWGKTPPKSPADYGPDSLPWTLDSYLTAARPAFTVCVKWSVIPVIGDRTEGDVLIYPDHRRFHIQIGDKQSVLALIAYLCGGQREKEPLGTSGDNCDSPNAEIAVLKRPASSSAVCVPMRSAGFITKQEGEPSLDAKVTSKHVLMKRPAGVLNTPLHLLRKQSAGVVKTSSNAPNVFEINDDVGEIHADWRNAPGRAGVTSPILSPTRSGIVSPPEQQPIIG